MSRQSANDYPTVEVVNVAQCCRWSDGFEIPCDNIEVVRVTFPLDSCDREIIGHVTTTGGISGSMVRDLMLESVDRRFDQAETLHPVEWLSDNGSCYTAR